MKITKDKLNILVARINELTRKFHLLHEYKGRYKVCNITENKETGFMVPKILHIYLTAYAKGLQEGIYLGVTKK